MKPLVIFGRSPFINEVDVTSLIEKYTTIGFNYFPFAVDYLFTLKRDLALPTNGKTKLVTHEEFDYPESVMKIAVQGSRIPLMDNEQHNGRRCYGFRFFTCSLALNWALDQGFTDIYLIGIDHRETDKKFLHFDGISDDKGNNLMPEHHTALKGYVYACEYYAKIYQCNPHVKDDWLIPYKPVEELLAG